MSNLKKIREELGLTQADLAKSIGTSKQYISALETGARDIEGIRIDTMERLCSALHCSKDDLLAPPELEYDADGNLIVDNLIYDIRYRNHMVVQIQDKYYLIDFSWVNLTKESKRTYDELTPIKNKGYENKKSELNSAYIIRKLVPRGGFKINLGRAITPEEFDEIKQRYSLGEDDISNEFVDVVGRIYGKNYRKEYTSVQIRVDSMEALNLESELREKGIEASNIASGRLNIRVK